MRSVARAEPSTKISGFSDWHTSQVGADSQHHQPFGLLHSVVVILRISQGLDIHLVGLVDFVQGSVSDENGLSLPFNDDVGTFWNGSQLDLDLGHGQNISRGRNRRKKSLHGGLGTDGGQKTHGTNHKVGEVFGFLFSSVTEVQRKIRLLVAGKSPGGGGQSSNGTWLLV